MPRIPIHDAASLILLRKEGRETLLLMGRRSERHRFMPGVWVFPGGRLDRGDYHMRPGAALPMETAEALAKTARLARQDGMRLATALALTAVRETFEETGIMLASPGEKARGGPPAWRPFLSGGHRPDLSAMRFLTHAITPPGNVRRYDTRFLVADVSRLTMSSAEPSEELIEVGWFPWQAAFKLRTALITRYILERTVEFISGT